jgi:glycogen phosphorylase
MRSSMAALAPRFSSVRMLQEYVERAYVPGAISYRRRAAEAAAVAQTLEQWSRHLERHWIDIRFGEITETGGNERFTLSVAVFLGEITSEAVRVELYANPENANDAFVQQMTPVEPIAGLANAFIYRTTVESVRPASNFTPRVVPFHPDARIPIELPLIAWPR